MSREILIEENKILKLKNVLSRLITFEDKESMDKKIHMMENYIKTHGLESFGPLVFSSSVMGGAEPKLIMKALLQLKTEHSDPITPYEFITELKVGPCLFARFEGEEHFSGVTQSKLEVYAYEHGIILDTKSYNVFKERKDSYVVMDIFVPIVGREEV